MDYVPKHTTENHFLMVKSLWFVMLFVVETIKNFFDGFIFIFFSRDISLYQLYSGIVAAVCHMTSMRAPRFTRYRLLLEIAVIHDMVKNDWINNT